MPTPTLSTAATILTQVRAETSIGSNPTSTSLQDSSMLRQLNDVNSEFVNYPYFNGMLGWTFLFDEQILETKANTALDGSINSGATSLVVDSAAAWTDPATTTLEGGYIRTGNEMYDYFVFEDIATATMSSVTQIDMGHANKEEVHKIYKLNTNYGKPRNMFRRSNTFPYFYEDDDFYQVPRTNTYFIKHFVSKNNFTASFVVFPTSIGVQEFKFNYIKAPTTISKVTDNVDAPDGTPRRFIIEKMKEYVWNVLGEEGDAAIATQRANIAIDKAAGEWSTQTVEPTTNLKLRW